MINSKIFKGNLGRRFRSAAIVIGRLGLALLFFQQLFWKLPPNFGCGQENQYAFSYSDSAGNIIRGSGLCDWVGLESIYAKRDRYFFVTDINQDWKADIILNVTPLVRLNGAFIDKVVIPHVKFWGWVIWLSEAFIAVSMILGIFSRLGAFISLCIAIHLTLGLGGISDPFEWEWSYHQLTLISILMLGLAPGRYFGLDKWIRPKLLRAADKGNYFARVLSVFA